MNRSVIDATTSKIVLLSVFLSFSMMLPAIALDTDTGDEPYPSMAAAKRHGALVAKATPKPVDFDFEGITLSIREAWIQKTRDKKAFQLCFKLKGLRRKRDGFIMDFRMPMVDRRPKSLGVTCGGMPWNCVYNAVLERNRPLEGEYRLNFYGRLTSMEKREPEPLQSFKFVVLLQKVGKNGK